MNAILFRDLLLNMLLGLTALVLLVLPNINPPTASAPNMKPPGSIAASIAWPAGSTDIDLWVSGPGEKVAIGYSNKSGKLWSLLRDDLGTANDISPVNMENAFARETPAGEYVVNAHCYSCSDVTTAHVEVALNGRLLVSTNLDLKPKQERTVVRFTLDGQGRLAGSNTVFKPLRSASK